MKVQEQLELLEKARAFDFGEFKIEWRAPGRWAVLKGSWSSGSSSAAQVYNREEKKWEYEPSPSSRSDDFKKRTRYDLDEAVSIATDLQDEFLDWCEANK